MKERLLASLMVFCLLVGLLPGTALAVDTTDYIFFNSIEINGVTLNGGTPYYKNGDTAENQTGTAEDWNVRYEPETGTLTFKDFQSEEPGGLVYKNPEGEKNYNQLNLVLEGENKLRNFIFQLDEHYNQLIISGTGSLTVENDGADGITANKIIVKKGTLNFIANPSSDSEYVSGIKARSITVESGTLTGTTTCSTFSYYEGGIQSTYLDVHGGVVNGTAPMGGIGLCVVTDIRVENGEVNGSAAGSESVGIYANNNITVNNGTVTGISTGKKSVGMQATFLDAISSTVIGSGGSSGIWVYSQQGGAVGAAVGFTESRVSGTATDSNGSGIHIEVNEAVFDNSAITGLGEACGICLSVQQGFASIEECEVTGTGKYWGIVGGIELNGGTVTGKRTGADLAPDISTNISFDAAGIAAFDYIKLNKGTLIAESASGSSAVTFDYEYDTSDSEFRPIDVRYAEDGTYKYKTSPDEPYADGRYKWSVEDGYVQILGMTDHEHSLSEDWDSDADEHWNTCEVCEERVNSAAHEYGEWTVTQEATETEPGSRYRDCAVCGWRESRSIPAIGHQHVWAEDWSSDGKNHWHVCGGCDEKSDAAAHTYGEWTVTKEAAINVPGSRYQECTVCGWRVTETIPALEHKHIWAEDWSFDSEYHWHDCTAEGCWFSENNVYKDGWGSHSFEVYDLSVDAECKTCGYVRKGSGGSGSGSGSSGGGGGGGGSSSSSTTVTVPMSGGSGTVQVSASVSGTTAAVSEVDVSKLAGTSQVTMDFSGLGKTIETVQLPAAALKSITSVEGVDSLSIKLSAGEVAFDASALESIQNQAGAQVSLTVAPAKSSDLNARQKEVVGSAPVFDLRLQSGSKAITSFGGGYATVSLPYTLPAGQDPGSVVVYYLDGSGNIQPCQTMYDVRSKTVIFTTGHFSLYFVGQAESDGWKNPFVDVRESDWFYEAVKYANINGLLDGLGGGRFAPNANLSRAQLAQILYAKEGRPASGGENSFTDVDAGKWYTPAVVWAAEQGIVSGFGDGRFGPDNNITREQLALMLWRYAGSPAVNGGELRFTDADQVSDWALEAVRWAVENGIVSGHDDGRLAPQGLATRAQAAQMLKNFLEK